MCVLSNGGFICEILSVGLNHLGFCPWGFFHWGFSPLEVLSTGIFFTLGFVHVFFSLRDLPTWSFVHGGFLHLGFCPCGFHPLGFCL